MEVGDRGARCLKITAQLVWPGTADDFYANDKISILQKFPLNTQPTH